MAKRKKKSGGGGVFGGKVKSRPPNPFGYGITDTGMNDDERGMRAIQRALVSKNLRTPEELERFLLDKVADKPFDELMETLAEEGLRTELEEAEDLMDSLNEFHTPLEVTRTAREALKIFPECLEAWRALGVHEEDPQKSLEIFDLGIAYGRLRYGSLISYVEGEMGIWGWIEARDFLRLMEQRAIVLQELERPDEAIVTYQEIMALNPDDNQSVRGNLLRLLLVFRRLEDANALLERFKGDIMPDIAFGSAFVSIVEAMDRTGYELPVVDEPGGPDGPEALLNSLGPEFDEARKRLKKAVEINPFVALFIHHPQIMGVEVPDLISIGGPYEAVVYSRKWAPLWYAAGLPLLLLSAFTSPKALRLGKMDKRTRQELAEVMETLDELNDEPGWGMMPGDE
jgi:tetratricopeptide (TPR) repeat protein